MLKTGETQQGFLEYPKGLTPFLDKQSSRLWYKGKPSILNGKLVGIVSARRIEPDLALKAAEVVRELATLEVGFIGGWHSPLEEEALRILITRSARVIVCTAKSLDRFKPSPEVTDFVNQGRALLLTRCSPKARRISRDASIRRNELVLGLANGLVVLSAPAGSASFKLAQLAVGLRKPVFAPPHPINQRLLASGAVSATAESIREVLQ